MKKLLIVSLSILILMLVSCHEIGIRDYENEVDFNEFNIKYYETYNSSVIQGYKDKDFMYYWDYEYENQVPYTSPSGKTLYKTTYDYATFDLKQDIDNKVIKTISESIHRSDYFQKDELKHTFYFDKNNKTIRYDEINKKEIDAVYRYEHLWFLCCNYHLLILKDTYDNDHKFYIDDNVYTIYYYKKDVSTKLDHAILTQITFKENKVCYYYVEEKILDGEILKTASYMEFLFKNVNFKNNY